MIFYFNNGQYIDHRRNLTKEKFLHRSPQSSFSKHPKTTIVVSKWNRSSLKKHTPWTKQKKESNGGHVFSLRHVELVGVTPENISTFLSSFPSGRASAQWISPRLDPHHPLVRRVFMMQFVSCTLQCLNHQRCAAAANFRKHSCVCVCVNYLESQTTTTRTALCLAFPFH